MKKFASAVLIIAFAFLAGFGGGMLANQQSGTGVHIDAFGTKYEVKTNQPAAEPKNVTINVSNEATIAEAIAEKAMPSVVGITTTYQSSYQGMDFMDMFDMFGFGGRGGREYTYDSSSVGTGFIIDAAGYILTNSHVVNDGTFKEVTVSLYDGEKLTGQVLWNDSTLDLAVVKVEAEDLTPAEIGDSDTIKIGSYAAAIGNPLGLSFERSMSQGIISGLDRTITVSTDGTSASATTMENLIQTDATINSGNSGGPLFNSKGQVIGINSAKASNGEGMGFAIPINIAKPIVEQIKASGKFERPYLGIMGSGLEAQNGYTSEQLLEMFGTDKGIYVSDVTEGGGAAKAGLQKGDVIIKVNGTEVGTMNKINSILIAFKDGDTVTVEYLRDKEVHTTKVTLTK